MANDPKFERINLALNDLQLDRKNPRISLKDAADERECIERLSEDKGKQLQALAKDIAENELSIEPIVVAKDEGGNWIVKDGNRRVAALKMLNNPNAAPESMRKQFERLASRAKNVPNVLECHTTHDKHALGKYLLRKHLGSGAGEGQLQWSALEQAIFEYSLDFDGQYTEAYRLLLFAESLGIKYSHDFPISTLTRLINEERLKKIGIESLQSDPVTICQSNDVVRRRLQKIIVDIDSKRIHVQRSGIQGSIYNPIDQEKYVTDICAAIAETENNNESVVTRAGHVVQQLEQAPSTYPELTGTRPPALAEPQPTPSSQPPQTTVRAFTTPIKPSWDRAKVITRKEHKVPLPQNQKKARDLHFALSRLPLDSCTVAAGMVVRAFVEITVNHYVEEKALSGEAKKLANGASVGLAHRMKAAVTYMHKEGLIDHFQKNLLLQKTNKDYLSIDSLNSFVHSVDSLGDKQTVNTFWDECRNFLEFCWKT